MSSTRRVAMCPPENRLVRMMGREPINAMTHLGGFMLAIIGVALLVLDSLGSTPKAIGMAIYGSSLALLFLASGAYHYLDIGDDGNRWLKRFDHCAIFLLIAGSYVPPLLHFLAGAWRITMLALVGGLAIAGIVLKLTWINCPRKLSTAIYLGLGWIIVIPGYRILPRLDAQQLGWLKAQFAQAAAAVAMPPASASPPRTVHR